MDSVNVVILALGLAQLIYIGAPPISFAHTITGGSTDKSTKTRNIAPDMNCIKYGHYIELFHLTELDPCFNRSVDIWEPLNELLNKQYGTYDCVDSIIKTLSIVFETPLQNHCNCTEAQFHLPYQNISYNPKTLSSHPSSTPTKSLTASSNHPSTVSSTLTNVITTTATHLPIVLSTTTKATPPSTTTVMSVTIAPPPRHGGGRRFVSDSVTNNNICLTQDLAFKELYELSYVHMDPNYPDEIIHYAPSLSHHDVWKKLLVVQPNCRKLLIQDLANTYGYNRFQANYTCGPGNGHVGTHATSPTIMPTTMTKITTTQTLHPTLSTHTTGHGPAVTTAKTHTAMPTTTQKTTMVQTQHQTLSTHTTGHGPAVTTVKTHTAMPTTTQKTTMVQTQHQTLSTHTTGHGPAVTTAKTHTAMPTTTLKTTMVPTQHQTLSTHTTGHIPAVTTAKTHTAMPTTALKTTMFQTEHQTLSTHTTVVTLPSSSTISQTAKPAVTMHTTSSAATTTYATCDGQKLTYGIEHQVILSPSSNCLSKVFHSEEVINAYCTIPPMSWTPGPKVMDMCQSLPNNTAVATFGTGTFNPNRDIAAIFVGCIDKSTGFRAAIALCEATIRIEEVTYDNTPLFHSPDEYYVVRNLEAEVSTSHGV